MEFDALRRLIIYARDRVAGMGRQMGIGVQVTTNGTLLDDEAAEFFADQGVRVHLSLDGPPDVHDAARPTAGGGGSYAAAVAGLRRLQERGIDHCVIGTVGPHNVRDARRVLDHLAELGVESVRLNPAIRR